MKASITAGSLPIEGLRQSAIGIHALRWNTAVEKFCVFKPDDPCYETAGEVETAPSRYM